MKSLYYKIRGVAVTWLLRLLPRNQGVVFAGAGSAQTLCAQALQLGHRRILVVTDAFLAGSGLLDGTLKQLEEGGAEVTVYDGVEPDPLFEQVEAGVGAGRGGQAVDHRAAQPGLGAGQRQSAAVEPAADDEDVLSFRHAWPS